MTAIYTFSAQERVRLGTYRAAVAAGFYSEFVPGRARRTDTRLLQRLLHSPPQGAPNVPEYPFSESEIQRLEACRAAIAHGYYSDELPR